jgi:hypothetical protein
MSPSASSHEATGGSSSDQTTEAKVRPPSVLVRFLVDSQGPVSRPCTRRTVAMTQSAKKRERERRARARLRVLHHLEHVTPPHLCPPPGDGFAT